MNIWYQAEEIPVYGCCPDDRIARTANYWLFQRPFNPRLGRGVHIFWSGLFSATGFICMPNSSAAGWQPVLYGY
jgi:hypothetical protein